MDNFAKRYPNSRFPFFRSIPPEEAEKLTQRMVEKLRLSDESSSLELVRALRGQSGSISHVNADSESFDLESTIQNAKISARKCVFVNWNRFDQIDEIDLGDLSRHFDDIWYPAADDVDIFDETLNWVISVGYSGEVRILIFDN